MGRSTARKTTQGNVPPFRGKTATKTVSRAMYPTKMSIRPAGSRMPPRVSYNDSSTMRSGGPELPSKSVVYDHRVESRGQRRKREVNDVGVRSMPRMVASASRSAPNPAQRIGGRQIVKRAARKESYYLFNGELLPLRHDMDVEDDNNPGQGTLHRLVPRSVEYMCATDILPCRAARKTNEGPSSRAQTTMKTARKTGHRQGDVAAIELPDTEPSAPQQTSVDSISSILSALSLNDTQLPKTSRAPFLRSDARAGFLSRCRALGLPTHPNPPSRPVHVTYRTVLEKDDTDDDSDDDNASTSSIEAYETKDATTRDWSCPLCAINNDTMYKNLPTREVLVYHLEQHHDQVAVDWDGPKTNEVSLNHTKPPTPVQ